MKKTRNAYLEKKIMDMKSSWEVMLELRLLVFLRSSSSYVLWLSACKDSTTFKELAFPNICIIIC